MKRQILTKLISWQQSNHRKPLIIKGLRQVGKTYSLQQFGQRYFANSHYLNFEQQPELAKVFQPNLDPARIINELSFILNTDIDQANDLIIFDEIQACPLALTSLKYFCEDKPGLAICAAGSLLGLELSATPFPVGKVDMLTLTPMTFEEFLMAVDEQRLLDLFNTITIDSSIPEIMHAKLWELLKIYFTVGGLPEVVATFIEQRHDSYVAFKEVRTRQEILITNYQADIAKHSGKVNAMHIQRVLQAVPAQLARCQDESSQRFKFKGVIDGIDRYQRMAAVIDWLLTAGLIIKVPITNSNLLPFSAYTKESIFKLYIADVGLLGALSELPPAVIINYDYGTYKGYVAENFVAQEMLAATGRSQYSWAKSQAEIEFLYEDQGNVIPIEVKSGSVTKAKSLSSFSQRYQPDYRVIFSANNLHIDQENNLHRYPLYLAGRFPLPK